ncbi:MAG: pyridoxamine 5'-phosphate oxidase, partial [Pseudomonadota bacterium]|nr:pyridoxamine 5'-phosphate oxidase [Pseudomonadota bacterium]
DDPMVLFEQWQRDASVAGLADPTGVVVATVQPDGSIRQRFVLLKGVSEDGFVFFTNYNSDKAAALAQNDRSSMLFPWNELDRQVSVSGKVEKIAESESDAYFAARPRASQIAAWTSQQSQPIASRGALEAQYQATLERFDGGDVPRPGHWGGFKLVPERIEFWQGGEDRLHDRFVYHYANGWSRLRLQP